MSFEGKHEYTRMATVFDEDYFKIGACVRIRAGVDPATLTGGRNIASAECEGLWRLLKTDCDDAWVYGIIGGHQGGSGIVRGVQVMFVREKTRERWVRWVTISDVLSGVIEMEVIT